MTTILTKQIMKEVKEYKKLIALLNKEQLKQLNKYEEEEKKTTELREELLK